MMNHSDDQVVKALNDNEVRDQAARLAPELFAALMVAHSSAPERFPLESADDLQEVLQALIGGEDQFRSIGVSFSVQEALDNFPEGFFPIEHRADLLKKAYMVISGAHAAAAQKRMANFQANPGDFKVSHPMPEGVL
jgi:hypothetical protein